MQFPKLMSLRLKKFGKRSKSVTVKETYETEPQYHEEAVKSEENVIDMTPSLDKAGVKGAKDEEILSVGNESDTMAETVEESLESKTSEETKEEDNKCNESVNNDGEGDTTAEASGVSYEAETSEISIDDGAICDGTPVRSIVAEESELREIHSSEDLPIQQYNDDYEAEEVENENTAVTRDVEESMLDELAVSSMRELSIEQERQAEEKEFRTSIFCGMF